MDKMVDRTARDSISWTANSTAWDRGEWRAERRLELPRGGARASDRARDAWRFHVALPLDTPVNA